MGKSAKKFSWGGHLAPLIRVFAQNGHTPECLPVSTVVSAAFRSFCFDDALLALVPPFRFVSLSSAPPSAAVVFYQVFS